MSHVLTDGNGGVLKYPYGSALLAHDNPHVSFPVAMTDAMLAEWNVFAVAPVPAPAFDPLTQKAIEATPVYDGGWKQQWSIVALSSYEAQMAREEAMAELRAERDRRLTECDWTMLPDAPITADQRAAWTAYRQQLRDLPENTANPLQPVWPQQPGNQGEHP